MRPGWHPDVHRDPTADTAAETAARDPGRVAADADERRWIPGPAVFTDGSDRDRWATSSAAAWSEHAGLPAGGAEVERLAAMLREIHQRAQARVICDQIWIYLPDCFTAPLPVFAATWRQSGTRDRRLRQLAGADDASGPSGPTVDEVSTANLGAGLRVMRHLAGAQGQPVALLSYAFRVPELATDLQVFTGSADLPALTAAVGDIERLVHAITVNRNTGGIP